MKRLDLAKNSVRVLNNKLHNEASQSTSEYEIKNASGEHAIAAGLAAPLKVSIEGNAGYYCAGMNMDADVTVHGSVGVGVAENMMSGRVHVMGDASQSAGATAHGGLLIIDGNASARCGISLKGANIVVKGSIGSMSAFMAQAGAIVVLGDAGDALGDSIYEAQLFVRGKVASLGVDCEQKEMTKEAKALLTDLLDQAGLSNETSPDEFTRYGSARNLYHFKVDNAGAY